MIADDLSGRHVALTGVTGFLGKVWLALVLERFPGIGRVSLLIRPGSEGSVSRFESIASTSPVFRRLRDLHGSHLSQFLSERISVVEADLDLPHAGMSTHDRTALNNADLFVHCAGLTDFDPDPKKALAVNTRGALAVAELAKAAAVPLVHVSTCYVAGQRDGIVPEAVTVGVSPNGTIFDPLTELADAERWIHKPRRQDRVERGRERARAMGWPNIYTWSKGMAEHCLAADPDLDLCIVRPSIVECAESFPFPGWNEGINTAGPLAWLISTAFRRFPATGSHRFDVIPVDAVARGLVLATAAALRGRAPAVIQLASSDVNPFTLERAVELTGLGLRRYVRKGGGTPAERSWFRHLDPIPAHGGWLGPVALRDWIRPLVDELDRTEERWPQQLSDWLDRSRSKLNRMSVDVDRIEAMLELYKPFIEDHDWCFQTDAARALSDALDPVEGDLRFGVEDLDWRHYWVDIEYPGLQRWCIPLLRGHKVAGDPQTGAGVRLFTVEAAASK